MGCTVEEAKAIVAIKFANADSLFGLKARGFVMPFVVWRPMGLRRAGLCNLASNIIELNTNYLTSKDWREFLDDTPLHELGHAICWQFYHNNGHNEQWKRITMQMGLKGNRCHNFAKPEVVANTRTRKKYTVYCDCGSHTITSVRYNRMVRGATYYCRNCKCEVHL